MTNIDRFRNLYLQLETLTVDKYSQYGDNFYSVLQTLRFKKIYPYYSEYSFIDFCRRYRNNISHQELDNRYLDFNDELIEKLEKIVSIIRNPSKALEFASKSIYEANIDDFVKDTIKIMKDKGISYIPIYSNEILIGVFSERSLFNYLNENNSIIIDSNTKFIDIENYIKLDYLKDRIAFVSENALYTDVIKLFVTESNTSRLSCVFITKHGNQKERIIGILTTYDIVKAFNSI